MFAASSKLNVFVSLRQFAALGARRGTHFGCPGAAGALHPLGGWLVRATASRAGSICEEGIPHRSTHPPRTVIFGSFGHQGPLRDAEKSWLAFPKGPQNTHIHIHIHMRFDQAVSSENSGWRAPA